MRNRDEELEKLEQEEYERERLRRQRIRRARIRKEQMRRRKIRRIKFALCSVVVLGLLVFGVHSCINRDSDTNGKVNNEDGNGKSGEAENKPSPTPQSLGFVTSEPPEIMVTEPVLICVDAGHGFADPGCVSDNLENGTEADITLKVAKILKEKLEDAGAEVILTHDGETYPSAQEVKAYANQYDVHYAASEINDNDIFSAYERAVYCQALGEEREIDFFISLHINAVDNTEVSRYDIYYCKENPYAGSLADFCSGLEANVDNTLSIHETTKGKAMLVTKYSKFPSVLLEMGFATNLHDAANLNSEVWRQEFARTVSEQIVEFVNAN